MGIFPTVLKDEKGNMKGVLLLPNAQVGCFVFYRPKFQTIISIFRIPFHLHVLVCEGSPRSFLQPINVTYIYYNITTTNNHTFEVQHFILHQTLMKDLANILSIWLFYFWINLKMKLFKIFKIVWNEPGNRSWVIKGYNWIWSESVSCQFIWQSMAIANASSSSKGVWHSHLNYWYCILHCE